MKFVENSNEENVTDKSDLLFKGEEHIDLLKTEVGFEDVSGNSNETKLVEPKAQTITNPEQLETVETEPEKTENLFSEEPVKEETLLQEESPIVNEEPVNPVVETPIVGEQLGTPIVESPVNGFDALAKPKKKKSLGLIIVIVLLLALVAGGFVAYTYLLSPDNILKGLVNSAVEKAKVADTKRGTRKILPSGTMKGNIKIDSASGDYSAFEGYGLEYNAGMDATNKKIMLDLSVLEGEEDLFSGIILLKDETVFVDVDNLTPKMLKVDVSDGIDEVLIEGESSLKYEYLTKLIGDTFINSVDKNKIKRSISYSDIKENLFELKLVYKIDKEEGNKIINNVFNALKNDKTALKMLNEMFFQKEDDMVLDFLEDMKNSFNEINTYPIEVIVYTDLFSNKILKVEMIENNSEEYKFVYTNTNGLHELVAKQGGENPVELTLSYNEKTNEIKLDTTTDESHVIVSGTIKKEDNKELYNLSIELTPSLENETEKIKLSLVNTAEIDGKIDDVDTSGSVFIEDLTDEEATQMMMSLSYLSESLGLGSILE